MSEEFEEKSYSHTGFLFEVRLTTETNPIFSKTYLFFKDGASVIVTINASSSYALCKPFEMMNVSITYSIFSNGHSSMTSIKQCN
jgi:hypothetical protein